MIFLNQFYIIEPVKSEGPIIPLLFDFGLNEENKGSGKVKPFLTFIVFSTLFSSNCRSPNSPTPVRAPYLQTPVTTGIFITGETGPEPLGSFGNPNPKSKGSLECDSIPSGGGAIPDELALLPPYPNPFNPATTVQFNLPCPSYVTVYVVPARYINQQSQFVQFSNASINIPGGLAIDVLFNRNTSPGIYSVAWSAQDQDGRPFPDGFYRIYLKVDDQLLWQDVLLLKDLCNAPPGLDLFGGRGCH